MKKLIIKIFYIKIFILIKMEEDNQSQSRKQSEKPEEEQQDYNKNQEEVQAEEVVQPTYSQEDKLKACLQTLRKFPVNKYKKVIEAITTLIYEEDDLLNEFLQKIDQPSELQ